MRNVSKHPNREAASRAGRRATLPAWSRAVLFGMIILGSAFLLTSCLTGMQQGTPLASLPKVETSPPANYTKGAPAYTMLFHTMSSSSTSSPFAMPSVGGLMGNAMGGGDTRTVSLRMVSHPGPSGGASTKAYHMIPPGMNMGEYLPLLPSKEQAAPYERSQVEKTDRSEPERVVIKTYWGCGENVRKGQPRVFDTGNMKDRSMPSAMWGSTGRGNARFGHGGAGDLKPGWVEALWPNKDDSRQVPSSASLVGGHFLHGNFLPHIRFNMDAQHDMMQKLSLSAEKNSLKEAIPITWKKLPTAIGYHLMAFAYSSARKEMIIWTSSENPDINVSSQFLDTSEVRKHVAANVIMPADRDRCVIPMGIFDGADMVMVTGTAWGDDYWASEPPRPAKPPKNWKPDWVVKGQFLSTGSLMLGMPDAGSSPGATGSDGVGIGNILRGIF